MGKIINATYMTLDGDIANMQDWHFDYFGEQATQAVLGRVLVDGCDRTVLRVALLSRMRRAT